MNTRQAIMTAAEKLFAEKSFARVSVRQITKAAGVNLAAVHYHFVNKEGLIFAIVKEKIDSVNAERLRLLADCCSTGQYTIEDVVACFVRPPFKLAANATDSDLFLRLIGQINTDVTLELKQKIFDEFEPVLRVFLKELIGLLPEQSPDNVRKKLYFSIGAMAHSLLNKTIPSSLKPADGNDCSLEDLSDDLIRFISAGLTHA